MRPQTTKANMRDERRRTNKRTHGEMRNMRRNKKSAKRKRRNMSKTTTPNREELHQRQQGVKDQQNEERDQLQPVVEPTAAELERDMLKKENARLQERVKLLNWMMKEEKESHTSSYNVLYKVHKAQARLIVKLEEQLKQYEDYKQLHYNQEKIDRWYELSGIAC